MHNFQGRPGHDHQADPAVPAAAARSQVEGFRGVGSGAYQAGVLAAPAAYGLTAAFTCTAPDRAELGSMFQLVSGEIESLMAGEQPAADDLGLPPSDNGVLMGTSAVLRSGTLSIGSSLFDARYGLAEGSLPSWCR